MGYLIVSINYKSAPVAFREKIAFNPEHLITALMQACQYLQMKELVILSTCNRTELYLVAVDKLVEQQVLAWLAEYHMIDKQTLISYAQLYYGEQAIHHIMSVASGLDSMVLGEPQILGQLKRAYASAQKAKTVRANLLHLFQFCFSAAKEIRSQTSIGKQAVSVAYAATTLAKQIFSDLKQNTLLLIGAGETIELVAKYFFQLNIERIIVVNRNLERAQRLSDKISGSAALLSELPNLLPKADIVVSSTASAVPVVYKNVVEYALKQRKRRPIFMVDLAVPRDIETEVEELEDVYLYTIDDLNGVIEENKQARRKSKYKAEKIIEKYTSLLLTKLKTLEPALLIKAYRHKMLAIRDQKVQKSLKALAKGADPDLVVSELARSLTNKLMHTPCLQLRVAASKNDTQKVQWMQEIYNLSIDSNE